jgi:hypothetical protein
MNFRLYQLISILIISFQSHSQISYKEMMDDNSYNFYEVVKAAELYFKDHPQGKGSGWKGYQRWKWTNEYKYYPSGDRSQVDPFFSEHVYQNFLSHQPDTKAFYNSGWRDLGPYRIDSITGHYSAGLGRVEDFYVHPTNDQLIYLGSRSGGFWRTSDGGANWINTTDFLIATGVDAIAVSPTNPDSILINVRNSKNGNTHGIYRSIDGGYTWTLSNFNPTNLGWGGLGSNEKIFKIAYHPSLPNQIFIGTSNGIYKSDDNLQTWTQAIPSGDITDIDFHPSNPNIIYLYDTYYWGANQDVIMRSTDGGLSYQQSAVLTGNNNAGGYISVSPNCDNCVYFASSNGVWKSTDTGLSFNFISNPSSSCDGFAVNDLDTSKMIYGYLDLFGSDDGGVTFNQIAYWSQGTSANFNSGQYVHADLRDAKCMNGVYYVATDGLLCKSIDNGQTWYILSQGTGIRENYSLGVSQSNHFRSISGSQDNGTSIKHQNTWLEFYGADGMEGIVHPLNDDWMIGSIQNGSRRLTKDGGITQTGATPNGQTGSWIAPLIYDPNQQMTVYSFGENIWKSEDFGVSWTNIGTPTFTGTITEAAIAQNNSNIILVSKGATLEKSIDGGVTFSDLTGTLPNSTITDIAFAPHNDEIIIVTYASYQNNGQKIYKSTNGGVTWTNITNNLGDMPIRKVVIDHSPDHHIYIGAEIGVFTMPLNGNTWTLYNSNLPNMAIEDLEIMWGTNTLRAATWGRGLWEYALVNRTDYPAIIFTEITDIPNEQLPLPQIPQYVTSVISYDNTVTSAFVKWSENNLLFNNTINMTNTVDSTWVSDTPIPGMGANTNIYFKVFAVGSSGDTTETYKFNYKVKPNCVSFGNMSYQTAVTLVNLETISNATGKTQPYSDYTSSDSCQLSIGENYDLTVHLNTDGNYTINSKVWIDWNQNGDFTDAGEDYDLGFAQNTADGPTSNTPLSITVPNNAVLGPTIMRVSAKYNSYPSACETNFDGEVEDYRIIIVEPQLNFNLTTNPTCVGDGFSLDYTGTYLDSINWSISNGSNLMVLNGFTNVNGNATYTGIYNLTLSGYLNGQSYVNYYSNIFNVDTVIYATVNATICEGESYILGNQTLTNSGTYTETFTTNTCDSVVTLTLNTFAVNTSVTQNNQTLTANLSNAQSYQWLDCNNNYALIPNETNQSFTSLFNGDYAVIINNQNCTDTSACFSIDDLGLSSPAEPFKVNLFPNPTKNIVSIEMVGSYKSVTLILYNELGQRITTITPLETETYILDLSTYSKGIYHLQITADQHKANFKIIKL